MQITSKRKSKCFYFSEIIFVFTNEMVFVIFVIFVICFKIIQGTRVGVGIKYEGPCVSCQNERMGPWEFVILLGIFFVNVWKFLQKLFKKLAFLKISLQSLYLQFQWPFLLLHYLPSLDISGSV